MIKVTALALFVALCNAEKETESSANGRRLLQFGAPPQGQPGAYNPYGNFGSILNSPMCQYDPQNCIDMLQNMYQNPGFYPQPQPQPYYNPYQQYPPPQQQPQPYPPQPQVQPPPISQTPVAPAPPAGNPAPAAPVDPAAPGTVQSGPPLGPNGQPLPVVQQPGAGAPPLGPNGQPLPPVGQPPIGGQPGFGGQPPMGGAPGFGAPPMGAPGIGGGAPGFGAPGIVPGIPAMLGPPVTEVNCGPPPATACAGRTAGSLLGPLNLGTNMANNFKLYCDTPGVCAGSTMNMDIRPNPANPNGVLAIEQILCSEPGACQGSTANIKNMQGNGNNIELSNLECSAPGACNGYTINGWGVSLNDVNCAVPGNCAGCVFNNMKTTPDAMCRDPFAPNAPLNPGCIIEALPCFGY